MKLTDNRLNSFTKLVRYKNTWGFTFEVYKYKTKFLVTKWSTNYVVSLIQGNDEVFLGQVEIVEDLEELFLATTRGEHL